MLHACAVGERTRAADRWATIDIADVCGDLASAVIRSASYRQCLYLVRTGDGWK
jgi:hypothetical protein